MVNGGGGAGDADLDAPLDFHMDSAPADVEGLGVVAVADDEGADGGIRIEGGHAAGEGALGAEEKGGRLKGGGRFAGRSRGGDGGAAGEGVVALASVDVDDSGMKGGRGALDGEEGVGGRG